MSSRRQVGSTSLSLPPFGQGGAHRLPLAYAAAISVIACAVQASETSASVGHMQAAIPAAFWSPLKSKRLIDPEAPTPGWRGANLSNCSKRLSGRDQ
jgi:hypothetical protein